MQPLRNNDERALGKRLPHDPLDMPVHLLVHVARRLVHEHNLALRVRIVQHRPRDAQQLLLRVRQVQRRQRRVDPASRPHHPHEPDLFQRLAHHALVHLAALLLALVRQQVVADRPAQLANLLRDARDARPQHVQRYRRDIGPVNLNLACVVQHV